MLRRSTMAIAFASSVLAVAVACSSGEDVAPATFARPPSGAAPTGPGGRRLADASVAVHDAGADANAGDSGALCAGRPPGLAPPGTPADSAYCGRCLPAIARQLDPQANCLRDVIVACFAEGFGGSLDVACFQSPTDGRIIQAESSVGGMLGWTQLDRSVCIFLPPCPPSDAGPDGG